MPPSKSGIADYSEALAAEMAPARPFVCLRQANAQFSIPPVTTSRCITSATIPGTASSYETALRHPGVVVMHEANLHHLIADITIRRGDWDAYLAEAECNGGADALAFARRVRKLGSGAGLRGPPHDAPAARSLARPCRPQRFRGAADARPGFRRAQSRPYRTAHGFPRTDRNGTRQSLGLDETTPLIGAFGYLKPYKRIAESLRALRRLVRIDPRVRMILVGGAASGFPRRAVDPHARN